MLLGISILFFFYILGELVVYFLASPIPGSVAGMLLLFIALTLKGKAPPSLITTSEKILMYLPLLLVPAGVGVMQYLELIKGQAIAIACALLVGTAFTMIFISLFTRLFFKSQTRKDIQK
ncbi:CidA/LrgA family protein [Litoribacillus peritrichatus]|uniref:CidA/LrgA family protein n=1 Tax=Litoribacillus peritrichatus TaxID=718191 RepID=A0ABP7M1J7_9GAMM